MNEVEIWKDIPNYEGKYQVSNLGRVKSLSRKICNHQGCYISKEIYLKQCKDKRGYPIIRIGHGDLKKSFYIHKLVAILFLNHTPCGHIIEVDHIDNDKTNNNVNNLQLISSRENISKSQKNKTSKYTGVCWNKSRNKWESQILINGIRFKLGCFINEYDAHLAYQNKLKEINKEELK